VQTLAGAGIDFDPDKVTVHVDQQERAYDEDWELCGVDLVIIDYDARGRKRPRAGTLSIGVQYTDGPGQPAFYDLHKVDPFALLSQKLADEEIEFDPDNVTVHVDRQERAYDENDDFRGAELVMIGYDARDIPSSSKGERMQLDEDQEDESDRE